MFEYLLKHMEWASENDVSPDSSDGKCFLRSVSCGRLMFPPI